MGKEAQMPFKTILRRFADCVFPRDRPIFFAALGQSTEMSLILSGMVNICQFVAGIPVFLYLDKMGRRKTAIFGGIAMGIPHIIMAGIVGKFSSDWESHKGAGWFGVALICESFVKPLLLGVRLLITLIVQISTFSPTPPATGPWLGRCQPKCSPARNVRKELVLRQPWYGLRTSSLESSSRRCS